MKSHVSLATKMFENTKFYTLQQMEVSIFRENMVLSKLTFTWDMLQYKVGYFVSIAQIGRRNKNILIV